MDIEVKVTAKGENNNVQQDKTVATGNASVHEYDASSIIRLLSVQDNKECHRNIKNIRKTLGLSYRTVKGLSLLIKNGELDRGNIEKYLNKDFYHLANMLTLAWDVESNLSELIPESFFEDDQFLDHSGITVLPDGFVKGNDELMRFCINKKISGIGSEAFADCRNLVDISYDKKCEIESIGAFAFARCINLRSGKIPDSVQEMGAGCFMSCASIEMFILPEKVTDIEAYTFAGCTALKDFYTIGYPVRIGNYVFKDCSNLTDMDGVAADIGCEAFAGCTSLQEAVIDSALIGERAYAGCNHLRSIHFRTIPVLFDRDCFMGCDIRQVAGNGSSCQLYSADSHCELVRHIR